MDRTYSNCASKSHSIYYVTEQNEFDSSVCVVNCTTCIGMVWCHTGTKSVRMRKMSKTILLTKSMCSLIWFFFGDVLENQPKSNCIQFVCRFIYQIRLYKWELQQWRLSMCTVHVIFNLIPNRMTIAMIKIGTFPFVVNIFATGPQRLLQIYSIV